MALYLGNQKVSLRSGQDPTFDYGFDSNGRLVFANKNATEINNFLNYDSTYSEILDLSNLSKMEKVAVNGTADRKMEGLKGLLVSPNAPFTGSSPQINASYTGLSKSALVSLFESAPYNVGYTKVGNPTIVDGVASGFSDTSYLQIPNASLNLQNILVHVRFTTGALDGTEQIIYQCGGSGGILRISFRIHSNNKLICYHGGVNKLQIWTFADITLEEGKTYDVEFGTINTVRYFKAGLADNMSDQTIRVGSDSDFDGLVSKAQFFGFAWYSSSDQYFNGSIDLNETYIKVNGVPWFTGKPAMTKTCSIVGATGTADLTQEDKNIILNKGWSLTVQ